VYLHHIGLATQNILGLESLFRDLGLKATDSFIDQTQGVSGTFYQSDFGNCQIELLQNLDGSETLSPWLKRGIALYHLGFEVDDIMVSITSIEKNGGVLLGPPVPAIAFQYRNICFLLVNGFLIELIQK
jgi:methylmalonyl-CoA/ethylmalonyl-CoA epimerase